MSTPSIFTAPGVVQHPSVPSVLRHGLPLPSVLKEVAQPSNRNGHSFTPAPGKERKKGETHALEAYAAESIFIGIYDVPNRVARLARWTEKRLRLDPKNGSALRYAVRRSSALAKKRAANGSFITGSDRDTDCSPRASSFGSASVTDSARLRTHSTDGTVTGDGMSGSVATGAGSGGSGSGISGSGPLVAGGGAGHGGKYGRGASMDDMHGLGASWSLGPRMPPAPPYMSTPQTVPSGLGLGPAPALGQGQGGVSTGPRLTLAVRGAGDKNTQHEQEEQEDEDDSGSEEDGPDGPDDQDLSSPSNKLDFKTGLKKRRRRGALKKRLSPMPKRRRVRANGGLASAGADSVPPSPFHADDSDIVPAPAPAPAPAVGAEGQGRGRAAPSPAGFHAQPQPAVAKEAAAGPRWRTVPAPAPARMRTEDSDMSSDGRPVSRGRPPAATQHVHAGPGMAMVSRGREGPHATNGYGHRQTHSGASSYIGSSDGEDLYAGSGGYGRPAVPPLPLPLPDGSGAGPARGGAGPRAKQQYPAQGQAVDATGPDAECSPNSSLADPQEASMLLFMMGGPAPPPGSGLPGTHSGPVHHGSHQGSLALHSVPLHQLAMSMPMTVSMQHVQGMRLTAGGPAAGFGMPHPLPMGRAAGGAGSMPPQPDYDMQAYTYGQYASPAPAPGPAWEQGYTHAQPAAGGHGSVYITHSTPPHGGVSYPSSGPRVHAVTVHAGGQGAHPASMGGAHMAGAAAARYVMAGPHTAYATYGPAAGSSYASSHAHVDGGASRPMHQAGGGVGWYRQGQQL